jgi:hypothetical protein
MRAAIKSGAATRDGLDHLQPRFTTGILNTPDVIRKRANIVTDRIRRQADGPP